MYIPELDKSDPQGRLGPSWRRDWNAVRHIYFGRQKPRVTVSLTAYFDDSREYWNGWGFHAIAGYIADTGFWDGIFAPRWKRLLADAPHPLTEFKTSDCRLLRGEFAGWTREEANAFTECVVGELLSQPYPTMVGVGTVIALPQRADEERQRQDEHDALRLALINVVGTICSIVKGTGRTEPVHFLCDNQPGLQRKLADLWSETVTNPNHAWPFELSQLDFEDSKKLVPIQAADLLAYETRKDLKSRAERAGFPRSMALRRLIAGHPHVAYYLDPAIIGGLEAARDSSGGDPAAAVAAVEGLPLLFASDGIKVSSGPPRYVKDPRPPGPPLPQ